MNTKEPNDWGSMMYGETNHKKMKKIQIKLEYKDKVYYGLPNKVNKEEEEQLILLTEKISEGKALNFQLLDVYDNKVFFPEKVLKESIITLLYEKTTKK